MTNSENNLLKVGTSKGERTIKKENIVSCKQFSFGSAIYLKDGTHFLMKERIPELRSILNCESFFVVSSDTMINLKYVDAVLPNYLIMSNGERFFLSERKRKAFFRSVHKFFELDYDIQI